MPLTARQWRFVAAALYIGLLIGGAALGQRLMQFAEFEVRPLNEPMVHTIIMTATAIFIAAAAIPFVPGAEIGLALMVVFGGRIAVLVYVAMALALCLAFLAGRLLPLALIGGALRLLRLRKAQNLVNRMAPLGRDGRIATLAEAAPRRVVPVLLRNRHIALILLLNLPGNSLLGGGGGIALTAGISGLFSFPGFLAATAVAVAPVPLLFLLTA